MSSTDFNIVICGGGLVGLVLASLLEQGGVRRVAVLEPRPPEEPNDVPGLRVVALSLGSESILTECGVWSAVPPQRLSPYRRMQVWQGDQCLGPRSLSFSAAETGVAALGHIVETDVLRRLLWQALQESDVELISDGALADLERSPDAVRLTLASGRQLSARLIVGADGARSGVAHALGLVPHQHSYAQQGLVTHVSSELPHKESAYQRFLPGGPLALLPLADGRSSVVWSLPDAEAKRLLAGDEQMLGEALTEASQSVLGRLTVTTSAVGFPLRRAHLRHYCDERYVVIGDAAHQVHPLAGLGANLGLKDADTLARLLTEHAGQPAADPGDRRVLRRYERARKTDNLLTMGLMDGLHRLFSTSPDELAALAGAGLGIVDRLPPVKRLLANRALGQRELSG